MYHNDPNKPEGTIFKMSQRIAMTADREILRRFDTGVIVHIYYPDMWSEFVSYLSNLGGQFDLYITIPKDIDISDNVIQIDFPDANIYRCENRGRDIAPFLKVFSEISKLGYKYICKIHTKKSPHTIAGRDWCRDMLNDLLGSSSIISQIKKSFDMHPDWGIVGPFGHIVPWNYFWQNNVVKVTELAQVIGAPLDNFDFYYVAGSMFWFRPESLFILLNANINQQDFEAEQGQFDGTLAHAIERFIGLGAKFSGYKIAESDSNEVRLAEIPFHFSLLINIHDTLEQELKKQEQQLLYYQAREIDGWERNLILSLRKFRHKMAPANSFRERILKFLFRPLIS